MVHLARLELATFGLRVRYSWPIELQVDMALRVRLERTTRGFSVHCKLPTVLPEDIMVGRAIFEIALLVFQTSMTYRLHHLPM